MSHHRTNDGPGDFGPPQPAAAAVPIELPLQARAATPVPPEASQFCPDLAQKRNG
jgi:hypothetical protein